MSEHTYNVVGLTKPIEGTGDAYPCNTKTEMAQAIIVAKNKGNPIVLWTYQTSKGFHMLGDRTQLYGEPRGLPKLIECPICEKHGCIVCNYSGYTRNKHWEKWQIWQLERIKSDALNRDCFADLKVD